MSLDPKDPYDALAINAASASTQLAGPAVHGPIGGVRVALIDGQWIAFPQHEDLDRAVFDMVVAGRIVGDDVAIMMVEAEATTSHDRARRGRRAGAHRGRRRGRAGGGQAVHPHAVRAQQQLADAAAKPRATSRPSRPTRRTCSPRSRPRRPTTSGAALTIAGKQERQERLDA
jgi:polyribonucleotide nucleotidyltransferase